ncbi:RcnB family protein [Dyella jiangningensis]|nr:RcnB family protein [Dyella jiangningensis]
MKKVLFALALGALTATPALLAASAPYGQDHDYYDHDRGHDHDHDHDHDRDRERDHDRDHDRDRDHDHDRERYEREREHHEEHYDRRDYVIVHDRGMHEGWYHRGGYVPVEYRDRRYVVEDWRVYNLAPPPPEHQWVRSDTGEFLLVAAATGIITDIIINSH